MSHLPRNWNLSWAKLFFLLKKLYPNAFVNGWRRSLVAMAQRARCYFVQLWCLRALCSVRQHWSLLVLRGEGKPSSDRYCPFWNGENTSVPERMHGANRGPFRGENTDQHCDLWNIIKPPIQPFPRRLVFIRHWQELLTLIIIFWV